MGVLLILLGLLLAGLVADFLIENDVASAAAQPVTMFGASGSLSTPVAVALAFVLGALAVLVIVAGVRHLRRDRRKTLEQRVQRLEAENDRLMAQRNLSQFVRLPEAADVDLTEAESDVPEIEVPAPPVALLDDPPAEKSAPSAKRP